MTDADIPDDVVAEAMKLLDKQSKTIASQLVELAELHYVLGVADTGEAFAVEQHGPNVALQLRGGRTSLGAALAAAFYEAHGKAPSAGARADALAVIEGKCFAVEPVELPVRVAQLDGAVLVDLATPTGECVRVTPGRVEVLPRSPVPFRRTQLTLPLPKPAAAGDALDVLLLRNCLNVSEPELRLLIGWLLATLCQSMPHPVLCLLGEQGTGKSTFARMVATLVDPTAAPLRSAPRDETTWSVSAAGSWCVVLDNVSTIQPWLSDALCRAVTGDALVRRMLYSDADVNVLRFRRCVVLTSIDAGALRGDLAERLLQVELERIDTGRRRTEADVLAAFDGVRDRVFAGLLALLADVLAVLPTVQLDELPRMADFARLLAALDQVTGWSTLDQFMSIGAVLAEDVVEADALATAVVDFVTEHGTWSGPASKLLDRLSPDDSDDRRKLPKDWPRTAKDLSGALKRMAPALRSVGVEASQVGHGRNRRHWQLARIVGKPESASRASRAAPTPESQGAAGDAGDALDEPVTHSDASAAPADASTGAAGDARDAGDALSQSLSDGVLDLDGADASSDELCGRCHAELVASHADGLCVACTESDEPW